FLASSFFSVLSPSFFFSSCAVNDGRTRMSPANNAINNPIRFMAHLRLAKNDGFSNVDSVADRRGRHNRNLACQKCRVHTVAKGGSPVVLCRRAACTTISAGIRGHTRNRQRRRAV